LSIAAPRPGGEHQCHERRSQSPCSPGRRPQAGRLRASLPLWLLQRWAPLLVAASQLPRLRWASDLGPDPAGRGRL